VAVSWEGGVHTCRRGALALAPECDVSCDPEQWAEIPGGDPLASGQRSGSSRRREASEGRPGFLAMPRAPGKLLLCVAARERGRVWQLTACTGATACLPLPSAQCPSAPRPARSCAHRQWPLEAANPSIGLCPGGAWAGECLVHKRRQCPRAEEAPGGHGCPRRGAAAARCGKPIVASCGSSRVREAGRRFRSFCRFCRVLEISVRFWPNSALRADR